MTQNNHEPFLVRRSLSEVIRDAVKNWKLLDTSRWRSVSDATLTFRLRRNAAGGQAVWANECRCKAAFAHFVKRLNQEVYGNAARRLKKKLRLIAALEKDQDGRWHFHVAIEPPQHMSHEQFENAIRYCWRKTDWGYREIMVRHNANQGWVDYLLKRRQKSGLEQWFDCIDLATLNNPIADA